MWWNGGWAGWLAMAIMMAVFWAAIIAVVVALVRGRDAEGKVFTAPLGASAMEILDARFARGEIDRVEYDDRRSALRS